MQGFHQPACQIEYTSLSHHRLAHLRHLGNAIELAPCNTSPGEFDNLRRAKTSPLLDALTQPTKLTKPRRGPSSPQGTIPAKSFEDWSARGWMLLLHQAHGSTMKRWSTWSSRIMHPKEPVAHRLPLGRLCTVEHRGARLTTSSPAALHQFQKPFRRATALGGQPALRRIAKSCWRWMQWKTAHAAHRACPSVANVSGTARSSFTWPLSDVMMRTAMVPTTPVPLGPLRAVNSQLHRNT